MSRRQPAADGGGPPAAAADQAEGDGPGSPPPARRKKKYGFFKRFAYQRLAGWSPVMTAHFAEAAFLAAGTLCLAVGVPLLVAALSVVSHRVRYDDAGPLAGLTAPQRQALLQAAPWGVNYTVDVAVGEDMEPPVYVQFELGKYVQNYRRYVRSYDAAQMHDGTPLPGASACRPYQFVGNAEDAALPADGAVLACGQISASAFNDTFAATLVVPGGGGDPAAPATTTTTDTVLDIDDSGIAWDTDSEYLYGAVAPVNYNVDEAARTGAALDAPVLNEAQHWMVWMKPAAQSPLVKPWGVINARLPAGSTVRLAVTNRYNTYGWGGAKYVQLTTNSWAGGQNYVLPGVYLAAAAGCYAAALGFALGWDAGLVRKRALGDVAELSWMRG